MPFDEWLLSLAEVSARGLIVALPITLAVVATFSRVPATPWLRYPALALALTVSVSSVSRSCWRALETGGTFELISGHQNQLDVFFFTALAPVFSAGCAVYGRIRLFPGGGGK